MKKVIILLLISVSVYCQDTILLKNGTNLKQFTIITGTFRANLLLVLMNKKDAQASQTTPINFDFVK